ncbi:uncharacterized protein LOC133197309 [Saccostrea echinata]|uniref:uncharacterized protein LOC133197309 n=1 Tax=Saccostrea echinata TaxID=191078 RepID=UPI002A814534|nr:uncharacterized protein LOC133197309 [Saccostrea echinata]
MLSQFIFQIQEFEASVLRHVHDDKEGNFFASVSDFKEGRYFIKTKFHEEFLEKLKDYRATKSTWIYLNGIEGLGKTSSAIYYVFSCRENGDLSVHYVDLNKIEKRDEDLESFVAYSKKFEDKDCVIVDHLTLYNTHYLEKIKRIVERQVEDPKFILIETGFTASAHKFMEFGRKFQLDEDSFLNIWKGSLEYLISKKDKEDKNYGQRLGLLDKGKEVYDEFSKEYIMTPKLLNSVLEDMYTRTDGTVVDAFAQYTKEKQHKIINCKSCENNEYAKFQLHTAVLLHFIPNRNEIVMKGEWAQEIKIGINIFEVERYKIQTDDLQSNLEYARMGLGVGDVCVKIQHLIPNLANCWRERFPYDLEQMLRIAKTVGFDKILPIMFQHGGARKEFEKMFVECQKVCKSVLLPFSSGNETLYQPSQKKQKVLQTPWKVASTPAENFFERDGKDLSAYYQDIPQNLKGHERSVALFSLFIKQLSKSFDRFLVYPQIPNFMGVDYFVFYGGCGEEGEGCTSCKKVKVQEKTLYLVQVATGAMHRGDTLGQALNIVKQLFVNEDIVVHAVVIVASRNKESCTLTRCAFKNISVLNLDGTEELLLQKNYLLYDFYLELVRFT